MTWEDLCTGGLFAALIGAGILVGGLLGYRIYGLFKEIAERYDCLKERIYELEQHNEKHCPTCVATRNVRKEVG